MYSSREDHETESKSPVQTSLLDNWTNDKIPSQAPGSLKSKSWFRNDGSPSGFNGNGCFFAMSTPVILRTI